MPEDDTPKLSIVHETEEVAAPPPPPSPPQTALTVDSQMHERARLIATIRQTYKLTEGGALRLLELTLNERFTMIQMGLARALPSTEVHDDNQGTSFPDQDIEDAGPDA